MGLSPVRPTHGHGMLFTVTFGPLSEIPTPECGGARHQARWVGPATRAARRSLTWQHLLAARVRAPDGPSATGGILSRRTAASTGTRRAPRLIHAPTCSCARVTKFPARMTKSQAHDGPMVHGRPEKGASTDGLAIDLLPDHAHDAPRAPDTCGTGRCNTRCRPHA